MKIIVGLGNPGREYERTRHNIGFRVVDALAAAEGWSWKRGDRDAAGGLTASGSLGGERLLCLKPQAFMNASGFSVRAACSFHRADPTDLLVVCDDYALPLGHLRIRREGSSGGHNGLEHIASQLGTSAFPRLRIGIGSPDTDDPADYVLGRFPAGTEPVVAEAVEKAVAAIRVCVAEDVATAMNRFNRRVSPPPPPEGGAGDGPESSQTEDP
ncbi:MAG: aminoacyl-tRNA hydrolase [Planctomycetes bacterium]|nr:aminoacyl-tRNA hydrolase [Planctomycetota bacterium]